MLRLNESFEYVNVEMTAPGCSVHALEHLDTEKRGCSVKTDVFVIRSQTEMCGIWSNLHHKTLIFLDFSPT